MTAALVIDLINMVPLFTGKVDSTSTKLSKENPSPFSHEASASGCKVLMTGGYGMFEEKPRPQIGQ